MKSRPKLSCEERRAAIIEAVRTVFAEKGFHATTTRELAQAAGVSEALLFKHFPTKEALFSAIKASLCGRDLKSCDRFRTLEPSAATLVMMTHFMVSRLVERGASGEEDSVAMSRLMLRSLSEDGEFARTALRGFAADWIPKVEECLRAAVAAGDAAEGPVRPALAGWFAHHLAVMLMTHALPAEPVIDYNVARARLVEQAVWFALRGMGLKDTAIKRNYNPKELDRLRG
jgi:AcrR family transcriptional regulator